MHPAEHRGLRELHVFARQLASHWDHLGRTLAGPDAALFAAGARDARAFLDELSAATRARDLHARPAAALSSRLTSARPLGPDHLLERNQAMRYALLDVQHCVTLLGYLAGLAATRGDEELRALLARGQAGLSVHETAVRAAIEALAGRPDDAVAAAIPTVAGRLGQRLAAGGGAIGEWVD